MLRQLHIQNLAVIEQTSIEFGPGLNVFTGQTGAGKSLILGAIESILGLRKSAGKMVRPGTDHARLSALFEVHTAEAAEHVGLALDLDLLPGDELLIARKVFASGRSSLSANGQPVTAAMAKRAAEGLIDIHGQHDHQSLMRPGRQLELIDCYAGSADLRRRFAERYRAWSALREERERLQASSDLRDQQLDLYRFQADEIDAAEPVSGEMMELQARERLLGNLCRIKQDAGAAYSALYESDGSVAERLQAMTHLLLDLADVDEALEPIAEQVRTATLTLQESAFELSRYTERLELDPEELAEVESRLNTLNRLIQKYGDGRSRAGDDDPLAPVLQHRQHLGEQIDQLAGQSENLSRIDEEIDACETELHNIGGKLSAKRHAAAKQIGPKVQKQLAELGMREATLRVEVETVEMEHASANGLDRVAFVARTNPGQDERPLREIASGGELSRVMLALKSVLSAKKGGDAHAGTGVDVLVFDEIDANIGGRLGDVIGRKLRQLAASKQDDRQVLCITHLPQIAAFADRHFHIVKQVVGSGKTKHTDTSVAQLTGKARVDELAEMLAGAKATTTSRKQAKELIAAAV
jgi:DNA repair protein RecN (Recombination protein N)